MATLFICPEIESRAEHFYELVSLLERWDAFNARCEKFGWTIEKRLDWIPAVTFLISETDTFSLRLDFSFPENETNRASACICAITYYDEDTNTKLNDHEVRKLDSAFDQAYFNFLSQMETRLGAASRHAIGEFSGRKLNYAVWEQPTGLLILQQTLGDLHCGIDWEIHVSLCPWRTGEPYPDFSLY